MYFLPQFFLSQSLYILLTEYRKIEFKANRNKTHDDLQPHTIIHTQVIHHKNLILILQMLFFSTVKQECFQSTIHFRVHMLLCLYIVNQTLLLLCVCIFKV